MNNGKKVLLIEDEFFISDLYKHILSDAGIRVEVAEDGEQALQKSKADNIGLILLDIMLPGLNGIEVLKKLKEDPLYRTIPVVLLTNLVQSSVVKLAYNLGASGYLLKVSLKPEDLVRCVQDYFKNPNLKMRYETLDLD
ncbi:MAG: response regulator [Patescibacteria group bacterium]